MFGSAGAPASLHVLRSGSVVSLRGVRAWANQGGDYRAWFELPSCLPFKMFHTLDKRLLTLDKATLSPCDGREAARCH